MNTMGEFEYVVRSYECGPDSVATLPSVMNYLQEAASLQAAQCGFSRFDFMAEGKDISWVITRFHLRLERYPRWREALRIVTWPSGGRRVFAERDYELFSGDERLGVATSEWVLIDLNKRQVAGVPEKFHALANDERPRAMGANHVFQRLKWNLPPELATTRFRLKARRGDIDLNGHVNNVHYVEWLMEALPPEAGKVREFEILYKTETLSGEEVTAESVETERGVYLAHIVAADGRDHVIAKMKC